MTVYADFDFYEKEYLSGRKAAVTAADFPFYARQASSVIARYTYGNIKADSIPESVKNCCCELAELLYSEARITEQSSGVSSESVQGWSRTYENEGSRKDTLKNKMKECVYRWITDTGLLYSGVRRC